MNVPEGDLTFAALASLPTEGNALTLSADGAAILRIEISPQCVADLTAALMGLRLRTFYLVLLAKPKVVRDEGGTQQDAAEQTEPEATQATGPRRRRRDRGAAGKPDRRTH